VINSEAGKSNCVWVTIASLIADGTRKTTKDVYKLLEDAGVRDHRGPATKH